ncbi:hypothetical protein AT251_12790 [Enterovibrio nigricans]|nr:hypothetical protein AT251_12790 [Enterovibrio nigricans]
MREMFGPNFASVIEGSKQKMEIVTYDRSNNASDVQTIYFKTTFDLPTFLVYTPFMNANVELRGMNSEGMFDPNAIDNCVTMQVEEQLDVASCQLRADLLDYKFLQIKLSNPGSGKAFYYQWHDDESFLREIDLNQGGFWAYFSATNTNDFYITELSAYHTGLFDFLWGQEENRTHETALANLQQVNTALSDKTSNSFFKFNPVTTRYATNIDLVSIPTVPGDEYVHRFFVESLYKLATTADATSTSVDFASAFYQDFVFDGKANGVGQNGAIKVGSNYFVTSVTYRESIASTFNELLTEKYFVSPQIALSLSDIFALANPSLSIGNLVHLVFDTAGNSIDDDPPSVLVKPSENQAAGGTFYKTTGDIYYIAGQVNFEASIADPSGIQGEPDINAYWYERNGDIPQPVEMHFNPSDDVYNKQYAFAFDSKDPRFENIFQFALNVIASDNKLNAYTAENPHITTFNVDNDYPAVTYRAPSDQSQETYLNVNRERILTFYIDDEIGDV